MLQQGLQRFDTAAVHDTVVMLLRERGYRRSILSSLLGRFFNWFLHWSKSLFDAMQAIPGGRYIVIGIVAVVALAILARVLLSGEWRDDGSIRLRSGGARLNRVDPWAEAEALAARGEFLGAAHALYQAVLRGIAGTERIRLHPSKTTGDYARELRRRQSSLAGPFLQFGRRFDRVVFGIGSCSPEDFAAMKRDAAAIGARPAP